MSTRPAIPVDIMRAVLFEAGHRCAVCGAPCPLEQAHIVPFRKCKEHIAANMICLCSNCHGRADREGWGEKTLVQYKKTPWILRQSTCSPERVTSSIPVTITIDMHLKDFSDEHRRLLQYGIAAFLGVPPAAINVLEASEGSVVVLIEIPISCYTKLLYGVQSRDPFLVQTVSPLSISDIGRPRYIRPTTRPAASSEGSGAHGRPPLTQLGVPSLSMGIPDDPIAHPAEICSGLSSLSDLALRKSTEQSPSSTAELLAFRKHVGRVINSLSQPDRDHATMANAVLQTIIMANRLGLFGIDKSEGPVHGRGGPKPAGNADFSIEI